MMANYGKIAKWLEHAINDHKAKKLLIMFHMVMTKTRNIFMQEIVNDGS